MTKPTCYHQNKGVVWSDVDTQGGKLVVRQLRHQCQDCGRLLAGALPHALAGRDTPEVDMDALKQWAEYDKGMWQQRRQEATQIKSARDAEWQEKYNAHIKSEKWRRIREAVLVRCQDRCEGCGRSSTILHVHHQTYDNLGNEFLWELKAVCIDCHSRLHPHREFDNEDSFRNPPRVSNYR